MGAAAKKGKKWIQEAIKRPGALHTYFGIPQSRTLSVVMLRKEQARLRGLEHRTKAQTRALRQINLALNLRGISLCRKGSSPRGSSIRCKARVVINVESLGAGARVSVHPEDGEARSVDYDRISAARTRARRLREEWRAAGYRVRLMGLAKAGPA